MVKKKKATELTTDPPKPRQLYVMRHGERVDYVFGRKDWCSIVFDSSGNTYMYVGVCVCLAERTGAVLCSIHQVTPICM